MRNWLPESLQRLFALFRSDELDHELDAEIAAHVGLAIEENQGAAFYELQHREFQIKQLKSKAEKLGYRVTPIPAAA